MHILLNVRILGGVHVLVFLLLGGWWMSGVTPYTITNALRRVVGPDH